MKVLVIGDGGREHALVWKLSQSKQITKLYASPGNAGISDIAECIDLSPDDFGTIVDFVKYEWIDLTIACSERLLAGGIVDFFQREGRRILGPDKAAARVGLSRVFAKNLLRLHGIPSAEYRVFTSYLHALDYIRLKGAPVVIKTDDRSRENGSFIAARTEEAGDILRRIMDERILGEAGRHVLIEELLPGERMSFLALTDGKTVTPLTSLCVYHGHERAPRVGGMGAYSPVPQAGPDLQRHVLEKIIVPLVKVFRSEGIDHKGFLSAQLIVNGDRVFVSELNCCLSDLEAQTVLPRLKTDLLEVISAVMGERLSDVEVEMEQNTTVSLVGATEGDAEPANEIPVTGIEKTRTTKDILVFHENTSFSDSGIFTSGGKVLCITSAGNGLEDAKAKAYRAMQGIHFEGMCYRKDIGENILQET